MIGVHVRPVASQRDHMYANEVGLFSQVPVDAFSSLPTSDGPDTDGGLVFSGSKAVEGAAAVGAAGAVGAAAAVAGVEVGTGLVSHHLATFGMGSPKTELLQSTPPVKVLGAVNLPFAPY